ncbi:MAG: hypothetical protein A4E72_00772 [Syntrophus sp. PtaU1.Bin208]|nr:MAG: hypothetical protein A4E72_00772 [Syntrophus sp. PtaU1.Bin208]
MEKNVDFQGASSRHFRDAELLMGNKRISNAGHLFGFAAECGIKALLVAYGLETDSSAGDIMEKRPYRYKTHVNTLINNVQTFPGSRQYSKYLGMMPNLKAFSDWNTGHRYWNESAIPLSCSGWRDAAKEVLQMLDQAKLDGVIK